MLASLIEGAVLKGHDVVGAIRIDRVKYSNFALFFKDIFNPSYDFSFLKSRKIYDIKAHSVNSKKFLDEVKRLKADIILVGSWSEKFLKPVLNSVKFGVVNCHPSLLPNHRGANPYFWAIYSGDEKTGVTFHIMDEKFDSGDILMQAAFKIEPYMTGGELKNKAAKVAELMTGELLSDLENGKIIPVKQDESKAVYDKYPYDGIDFVDFKEESGVKIFNKTRGLRPWGYPSCVLSAGSTEKVYRIKEVKILDDISSSGEFLNGNAGQDIKAGTLLKVLKDNVFYVKGIDSILEVQVF